MLWSNGHLVSSNNSYINDKACPTQPQVGRTPKLNLKFHDSTKKNVLKHQNKKFLRESDDLSCLVGSISHDALRKVKNASDLDTETLKTLFLWD